MVHFSKRNVWWMAAGLLILAALLAGSVFSLRWIARNRDPGPAVQVEFVEPEDPALVGQSVVVRGRAVHPEGIEQTELWVNGEKVTTRHLEGSPSETGLYFAFQPGGAGVYSMILKAKSVHGVFGSSRPRLVRAVDQEEVENTETPVQVFLREGDTVESVADEYHLDPEDLTLPEGRSDAEPGHSVIVLEPPEDIVEDTDGLEEEDSLDGPPEVEPVPPAEELVPLGGDSSDVPFWVELPGVDLVCAALPEACGGGPAEGLPAKPDNVINFALSERCQVSVDWTDQADNETGFRIFRVEPGVTTGLEMVGEHPPSPGTGSRLSFLDKFAGRGRFTYIVQAFNGAGQVYMPASGEVETRCDETYTGSKIPVIVEVVSLDVETSRNQLYCYFSFGREPFSRVPRSYGTFITQEEDGSWNISDYFSGEKGRRLMMPRESDLRLRGQCNVREGFRPLSQFSASIPPAHWDGREIVVGPEDGSYQASIRVFLSTTARGDMSLVDPDIPPPYNLEETDHWLRCLFGRSCRTMRGSALAWEYPTGVAQPRAYQVLRRTPGESEAESVHISRHPSWSAPIALAESGCALEATYSVNAITDIRDPITGEFIESPPSEEFEIRSECVELEITLEELEVNKIRDHCPGIRCTNSGGVYGTLWVGDQQVTWNFHCHKNCLRGGLPNVTKVNVFEDPYEWRNFYLDHGDGFAAGNHILRVQVPADQGLQFTWEFKEHDGSGGDDNWCANRNRAAVLTERSRRAWQDLDEVVTLSGDDGDCEVRFRVRGVSE